MRNLMGIAAAVALIWAGLSLGGNMIAATAKFQAPGLPMQALLQVGRAQFDWLSGAEWLFAGAVTVSALVWARGAVLLLLLLPVAIFLGQEILIMPTLEERTLRIIAGEPVAPSSLHFGFIAAELLKFAILCVAGVWGVLIKETAR